MLATHASAAANVRFKEIDPFANTVTLKNYGDSTELVHSWVLSSRSNNLGVTGDARVALTSGNPVLAPGAEIKLTILNDPNFLGRRADDLALHNGGDLNDSHSMVDYVIWGGSGGFRESVAVTAGIWSSGDFVELGETLTYTGDGSDTGPRAGHWIPKQTNVRLLRIDPVANQITVKNFDSTPVDIREWLFTIGGFSLSIAINVNLSSTTGQTVLAPGDEVTLQVDNVLLDPDGNAVGLYRAGIAPYTAGGMADFVQWVTDDNIREPVANTTGIWSVDAALESAPVYTYNGDGSDTGPRESYWNSNTSVPATPIETTLSLDAMGCPQIEFTSTAGRAYEVKFSSDLSSWTTVTPSVVATGSTSSWTDSSASDQRRRFYVVIEKTL